jgi:hypothetical protein
MHGFLEEVAWLLICLEMVEYGRRNYEKAEKSGSG